LLTDEGTLLSKGQFQRLAIARVCLSDADLIILDEPTASLDPISEKQIYETSMAILKGRTCLFISHRLGAVRGMDEILVMENGRLCETGTHDSLMAKGGVYSTLYTTQRGMYIDAEK
jgi:ATP-binding cassette subfamily B protein